MPTNPGGHLAQNRNADGHLKGALSGARDLSRRHDFVTLLVAFAAIGLFMATAGLVLPAMVTGSDPGRSGPDGILSIALILNIALIFLGWHRVKALNGELDKQRALQQEAFALAEKDDLTGCLNRRSFTRRVEDLLSGDRAELAGRDLAVIVIDLDNFKQVNDLNGHAAGDKVLVTSAQRIAGLLAEGAHFARLGGDEFICAVPYHAAHAERVDHLLARIVEMVARPVPLGGLTVDVSVSVGIASSIHLEAHSEETPARNLMHKADIAMYRAKKQGKNRFVWFEPSMENELRFRNELEAGIRQGIENGEFVPYYEQQIDLDTGELVGFEMLARWESPEMGLINPDIFIPIAEEMGAIARMSEQLIAQALRDALDWDPAITLSVNISPVQLRDPWFAQKILKMLVTHRFPAHRLEIEITETCLHENIGMVRSMITSLRNQGVKVSLDDFGTGYASLAQLRSLPFDRLKIDRSFIGELSDQDDDGKLVNAIVSMSDGLKMPITAEGIENETVLAALKQWTSLKGQGYHYGRPEPAAEVLKRLGACGKLAPARNEGIELAGTGAGSPDEPFDAGKRAG